MVTVMTSQPFPSHQSVQVTMATFTFHLPANQDGVAQRRCKTSQTGYHHLTDKVKVNNLTRLMQKRKMYQ